MTTPRNSQNHRQPPDYTAEPSAPPLPPRPPSTKRDPHQRLSESRSVPSNGSRHHSRHASPTRRPYHSEIRHESPTRRQHHHSHSESRKSSSSTHHRHHPAEVKKSCCSWTCCCRAYLGVTLSIGIIFAIAGIALVLQHKTIFIRALSQKLPIVSGSQTLQTFTNPDADLALKFYFFNLTNVDEVLGGAKPKFQQVGPYGYKVTETREQIDFNEDETDIAYSRRQFYHYDIILSYFNRYHEEDEIVTLDLVAYGGLMAASQRGLEEMASMVLEQNGRLASPFKRYKVGDLIWGADDELYDTLISLAQQSGVGASKAPPAKFGLMYAKNGTILGNYTVLTGKSDVHRMMEVVSYNGQTERFHPDVWPVFNVTTEDNQAFDANLIRGHVGGAFGPDVTKSSVLTAFVPDMCSSLQMKYWTLDVLSDVEMLRFGIDFPRFKRLSGELNRELCSPKDRNDPTRCAQTGVLNATACRDNLPVILSMPHFYEVEDDFYLKQVEGLRPLEHLHAPFINVEPLTGFTMRAAERVQLNFVLKQMPFGGYANLQNFTLFPVAWIEQSAEVTADGMETLKANVYRQFYMLRTLAYALLIIAIILLPLGVIGFTIYWCHEKGHCYRK